MEKLEPGDMIIDSFRQKELRGLLLVLGSEPEIDSYTFMVLAQSKGWMKTLPPGRIFRTTFSFRDKKVG